MGGGAAAKQGLYIRTRAVEYAKQTVVKYSEVSVISDFATTIPVGVVLNTEGLKIGMNFRTSHRPTVAYAAADAGVATPQTLAYTDLQEDDDVTELVEEVFGAEGQWIGFRIKANTIPLPKANTDTHLYFKTTLKHFRQKHSFDCHVVPIVVVLDSFTNFKSHYAFGIGTFTVGKGNGGLEFDCQTLTT